MLVFQSLWNSLLSKGFISIKADKTSNDSLKNSPGIGTAEQRVYLSFSTLRDNQDKDDSMVWNAAQRRNEIAATSGTKPDKMLFSPKWLLVLFTRTKKRPSFSINEAGNWVWGPAGYGLTMMAWGPNLTPSLCCSLHGGISHSRPWLPSTAPSLLPAASYLQLIHPFLMLRWAASVQTAISGGGR